MTAIGARAFQSCTSLASIVLSKNLKTIGEYAFANSGLKEAILPKKLKTLGECAFYDCNSLTAASVPLSVTKMGESVFSSCEKLKKLTISPELFSKASAYNVTKLVIPSGVTSIPDSAFYSEWSSYSFTQVTIPATVKTIGKNAFCGCNALNKVTLKEGLVTIGEQAFYRTGLTAVAFPASVTSIGKSAFGYCESLKEIALKDGLVTIGEQAFYGTGLTAVAIPGSVTSIGKSAFEQCSSLAGVTLNEGLVTIGEQAFYRTGLTAVAIPGSVTSIRDSAFYDCNSLATLTLNEGLKTIGDSAFQYTSLATVVIPGSVETIGNYAFYECYSLTSITIPRETQLGEYALPPSTDEGLTVRTYYNSPAEAYANNYYMRVFYLDAPTSITLNYTGTVQLEKYQSLTLVPALAPEGCAPYVTWKSSDTSVAEVSAEGVVSANKTGKATITVCNANGEAAASVDIEVIPPKPTSVSIDYWDNYVYVGYTLKLYVDIEPKDAEYALTWSSSDTGVATVDQDGVVTGISAGTAVITVTTDNGLSAKQTFTVYD